MLSAGVPVLRFELLGSHLLLELLKTKWRRVSCEQQLDTLFLSVEEIRVFQACTVESRFCVFVWWSGQRLLRCVLRAATRFTLVAQLALLERGFPCSSVVSSISVCVVRTCPLRTAPDATLRIGSKHTKPLLLSYPAQFFSSHMVAELRLLF